MTAAEKILKRNKGDQYGGGHIYPGARFTYYKIGRTSAKALVDEASRVTGDRYAVPRPGYEVRLPPTLKDGRPGHWTLSNRAGRFEIEWREYDSYDRSERKDEARRNYEKAR